MHRNRAHRNKGYLLLEAVLTLAILAMIIAIAIEGFIRARQQFYQASDLQHRVQVAQNMLYLYADFYPLHPRIETGESEGIAWRAEIREAKDIAPVDDIHGRSITITLAANDVNPPLVFETFRLTRDYDAGDSVTSQPPP